MEVSMQVYSASEPNLEIYRVIREFATADGVVWPRGAMRCWSGLEMLEFCKKLKSDFELELTAEELKYIYFEPVFFQKS